MTLAIIVTKKKQITFVYIEDVFGVLYTPKYLKDEILYTKKQGGV